MQGKQAEQHTVNGVHCCIKVLIGGRRIHAYACTCAQAPAGEARAAAEVRPALSLLVPCSHSADLLCSWLLASCCF